MKHYFAALDGKRFLLSDIAQDLSMLSDLHVPTLDGMLNVLQLLVRLSRTFSNSLLYSLYIALQPHTTLQNENRLLWLIVYRLSAITVFSHTIPESQTRTIHMEKTLYG